MSTAPRPRDEPVAVFGGRTAREWFALSFAAAVEDRPATPSERLSGIFRDEHARTLGEKILAWTVADPDEYIGVSFEEATEEAAPHLWRLFGGDKERFAAWCREYLISPPPELLRPGVQPVTPDRIREALEADRERRRRESKGSYVQPELQDAADSPAPTPPAAS